MTYNVFGGTLNLAQSISQVCVSICVSQCSYSQRKSGNFEGVRESQGKQRGLGKSQGILKYYSLDQLFMHYFHNFCQFLGALPQTPTGALPQTLQVSLYCNILQWNKV